MKSPRRPAFLLVLTWLAVTPLALSGCYQRVVGADESYEGTVYEPNLKEDEKIQSVDDMD